jgi:hypothetical protein
MANYAAPLPAASMFNSWIFDRVAAILELVTSANLKSRMQLPRCNGVLSFNHLDEMRPDKNQIVSRHSSKIFSPLLTHSTKLIHSTASQFVLESDQVRRESKSGGARRPHREMLSTAFKTASTTHQTTPPSSTLLPRSNSLLGPSAHPSPPSSPHL